MGLRVSRIILSLSLALRVLCNDHPEVDYKGLIDIPAGQFSAGERLFFTKSRQDMSNLLKTPDNSAGATQQLIQTWVNYALTQAMDREKPLYNWFPIDMYTNSKAKEGMAKYWPAYMLSVKQEKYPRQNLLEGSKRPKTDPGPSDTAKIIKGRTYNVHAALDPVLVNLTSSKIPLKNGLPILWPADAPKMASNCLTFVLMTLGQVLPKKTKAKLAAESSFPKGGTTKIPSYHFPVHQLWMDTIGFSKQHTPVDPKRLGAIPPGKLVHMWHDVAKPFDPGKDLRPRGGEGHVGISVEPVFCGIAKGVDAMCLAELLWHAPGTAPDERTSKDGPVEPAPPRLTAYTFDAAPPSLRSYVRLRSDYVLTTTSLGSSFAKQVGQTMKELRSKA